MLHDLRIRTLLNAGGVVILLIILLLGGMNIFDVRHAAATMDDVYHRQVVPTSLLQDMDGHLKEVRFRLAGVLLDQMPVVGSRHHLDEVRKAVPDLWRQYKEAMTGEAATEEEAEAVKKIDASWAGLESFVSALDKAYADGDHDKLTALLEDDWPMVYTGVIKPLGVLVSAQQVKVQSAFEATQATERRMILITGGVTAAALVVSLVLGVLVSGTISQGMAAIQTALARVGNGDLTARAAVQGKNEFGEMAVALERALERLRGITDAVKVAAERISRSTDALQADARCCEDKAREETEQVASLSSALDQMSVSIGDVATAVARASDRAGENEIQAKTGQSQLAQNMDVTRRVVDSVNASSDTIGQLSDAIQRIGAITKVIREIAEQTNLLALNAAIEAARAGEQGRGFAVVADEVRKLAERTSSSTGEISSVINEIQSSAAAAVDAMSRVKGDVQEGAGFAQEAHEALVRVLAAVEASHRDMTSIASASHQQAEVTKANTTSMGRIASLIEETVSGITRMGGEALQVAGLTKSLQQELTRIQTH